MKSNSLYQNIDKHINNNIDNIFYRLIFLGDTGVGKTQIINVYNNKLFKEDYMPTFSVDFQIKSIVMNGKKINIHCIDTEGCIDNLPDYLGKSFIKKADAFILVYDITTKNSFTNLSNYYKFSINDIEEKLNKKIIYLVGNKYDLKINRVVSEIQGQETANKYDAKFMEVSAKKSSTIKKLFDCIIQDIIKRDESSSSGDSNGKFINNNILSNVTTLRTNKSLKNSNDSENFSNYETSSYFLKGKNSINENNDYVNNLNNLQDIRNREIMRNSIYYKTQKKCFIF
jgi:small GTP-binding protein